MRPEAVLDRLNSVRRVGPDRWMAQCPHHTDSTASLSIRIAPDGRLLLHDFGAGCRFEEIVRSLGLMARDFAPSGPPPAPGTWRPRPRGLSQEAREDVLALWSLSDAIRRAFSLAQQARRVACQLGASERVWALLEGATRHEVFALAAEAELDEILMGRIA